jgi:hypothetical protein
LTEGAAYLRRREAGWEWFESSLDVESSFWVSRAVFN